MIAKRIGFALTASYCTFSSVLPEIRELTARGAQVIPIMSENAATIDTKFGQAAMWKEKILEVSRAHAIIETIVQAEPIGPGKLLDLLVVAPCTGNSLGKIANAITDSVVTMAVKAHLRNMRPVLIAVSTNDGLGLNAVNIGRLLNSKNVFFVPFSQDNPEFKQNSLVAHMNLIPDAVEHALRGLQLSPVLRGT